MPDRPYPRCRAPASRTSSSSRKSIVGLGAPGCRRCSPSPRRVRAATDPSTGCRRARSGAGRRGLHRLGMMNGRSPPIDGSTSSTPARPTLRASASRGGSSTTSSGISGRSLSDGRGSPAHSARASRSRAVLSSGCGFRRRRRRHRVPRDGAGREARADVGRLDVPDHCPARSSGDAGRARRTPSSRARRADRGWRRDPRARTRRRA